MQFVTSTDDDGRIQDLLVSVLDEPDDSKDEGNRAAKREPCIYMSYTHGSCGYISMR